MATITRDYTEGFRRALDKAIDAAKAASPQDARTAALAAIYLAGIEAGAATVAAEYGAECETRTVVRFK